VGERSRHENVFLNRCGQPTMRSGVHALVERIAARANDFMPSLAMKRVSSHAIRHSTASHLINSGVDIGTVRAWLGHASLDTTKVYAEIDFEGNARALANCEIFEAHKPSKPWHSQPLIMEFPRSL